jgi:hypothetical protein
MQIQPDYSPAADRNKQAILDVLVGVLPEHGHALEIASGTGQHVAWFASGLPGWDWQPSDAQPDGFASINAWATEQGVRNARAPVVIDVMAPNWLPDPQLFDLVYCANMLHIAPWATCAALMHGSAQHLAPGGLLVTYGPYLEDAVPTSPGNLAFDDSLRERNPAWGIRRIEDVKAQATKAGLQLLERHAMPANNLLLVWSHQSASA